MSTNVLYNNFYLFKKLEAYALKRKRKTLLADFWYNGRKNIKSSGKMTIQATKA